MLLLNHFDVYGFHNHTFVYFNSTGLLNEISILSWIVAGPVMASLCQGAS